MRGVPSARDQEAVVERFITDAITEADRGQDTPADVIRARLAGLTELPGGYDFARVITQYWHGYDSGEPSLMEDALRWLRAEFTHRTDARTALGVRTTISDATFYDHLKVLARFVRLAGYRGLLVTLDEMVNLYRLSNAHSRQVNYEQLLRIVNDVHQGHAEGLGFVFAGTVDFLTDTRRGVNSYAALETRLRENPYLPDGAVDRSGPVIGLAPLTEEDLYLLLEKLLRVQAGGADESEFLIPPQGIEAFLARAQGRAGEQYFRNPRDTIKDFLQILAVLEQHPDRSWADLLATQPTPAGAPETSAAPAEQGDDDVNELKEFRL